MLQKVVEQLAKVCDGNPLMMALVGRAVSTAVDDCDDLSVADIKPWQDVRDDLSRRLCDAGNLADFKSPFMAYEMSVERLDDAAKTVLSTLCLFPPAQNVPSRFVQSIWEALHEETSKQGTLEDLLLRLKQTAIVDKRSDGGESAPDKIQGRSVSQHATRGFHFFALTLSCASWELENMACILSSKIQPAAANVQVHGVIKRGLQ